MVVLQILKLVLGVRISKLSEDERRLLEEFI